MIYLFKKLAFSIAKTFLKEIGMEKKNISLQFRGSENQRIIDMKRTLSLGKVVLWDKTIKGK